MLHRIHLAGILFAMSVGWATASAAAGADCPGFDRGAVLPDSALTLCWRLDGEVIHVRATYPGLVWIGIGFGRSMADADAIVGVPGTGEVTDLTLAGRRAEDVRPDSQQNIADATVAYRDGTTELTFSRPLTTGDPADRSIAPSGPQPVVWAIGNGRQFGRHELSGVAAVDLASGAVTQPSRSPVLVLHALLMVASWGIAVPALILIARYYKVTPGQNFPTFTDNPFWFRTHRRWMTVVTVVSTIGLGAAWWALGGPDLHSVHGQIGLTVVVLGWFHQLISALRGSHGGPLDQDRKPRPKSEWFGDHYYMTRRRRIFETLHIPAGYLAMFLAFAAVFTGFFLFELSWYWYCIYGLYLLGLGLVWWKLARDGRHIRTYWALWGFDPQHPGNQGYSRGPTG